MGTQLETWLRGAGVVADLARLASLLSAAAAAVWYGPAEVARFLIVFLGLLIPRLARVPRLFDAALGVTLLLAAWSGVAHWYAAIWWWDLLVHFVTTGAVAGAAYLVLARLDVVADLQDPRLRRQRYPIVVLVTAFGVTAAVLWEFWEWFGNRYLSSSIHVGYTDTVFDMAVGMLGSSLAGVGLLAWSQQGWGTRRRDAAHPRGRDRDQG